MALGGAGDAVGPVQAGVEPLRAVGGAHLVQEHVGEFVVKRLGVFGGVEIAVFFAPVSPAAGEAMDDLLGGAFRAGDDVAVGVADGVARSRPSAGRRPCGNIC